MGISSARFSPKTDNNPQAFAAKVDIRRRVFDAIAKPRNVFDAFAGSGEMFSAVWKDADGYIGCDLKYVRDGRTMFAADNRRVLRVVDLAPYNVFDLDAYGSPWECAIIIADRRRVAPGELFGVVLTDGCGVAYIANQMPSAAAELAGVRRGGIPGMLRNRDFIIDKMVRGLAKRMNCDVNKRWEARGASGGKNGQSQLRYIGLVLKGRGG